MPRSSFETCCAGPGSAATPPLVPAPNTALRGRVRGARPKKHKIRAGLLVNRAPSNKDSSRALPTRNTAPPGPLREPAAKVRGVTFCSLSIRLTAILSSRLQTSAQTRPICNARPPRALPSPSRPVCSSARCNRRPPRRSLAKMVKTCAFLAAGAAAFQSCEPVFNNLRPRGCRGNGNAPTCSDNATAPRLAVAPRSDLQ